MKKIITSGLFFLQFLMLHSQNIDNPSFDSAYIGGIDRIHAWITSDAWPVFNADTVQPLNPLDHYISIGLQYHELLNSVQLEYVSAYHGPFAIKVFCDTGRVDIFGNPFRGFVLNGNHFYTDSAGYLDLKKCGTPFPYRPYKLIGHYMLEDNSASLHNYPEAVILLKKYNAATQSSDTIGYAFADIQLFPTASWRTFEMPINYVSSQVPDSIVVAFFSPALGHYSTLWVDSLGFDYTFPAVIKENTSIYSITFQYNAVENQISFSSIENISFVKIYNATGQLIRNIEKPTTFINVSNLEKGAYFVSVEFKNNTSTTYRFSR